MTLGSHYSIGARQEGASGFTKVNLASPLSLFQFAILGSSVSLRKIGRFGNYASILNFSDVASSISLRATFNIGSTCSVFGACRMFGSVMKVSLLDVFNLASSLSMRVASMFSGSHLSICSFIGSASTMSLRQHSLLGSGLSLMSTRLSKIKVSSSVLDRSVFGSNLSIREIKPGKWLE
jgi:hypothetical protein